VSGVQHVDCATFSTLSFFYSKCNKRKRKRKRKRQRERERKRKKKRKRKRKRNRERERKRKGKRQGKMNPGSSLEKLAAIVNPENKPTK